MGSGASVTTGLSKREIESNRHQMIKGIERFVINVYATCPRVEAMWLILSNYLGQKAFQQFVMSETSEEHFELFKGVTELLSTSHASASFLDYLESIIKSYFLVNSEYTVNVSYKLKLEILTIQEQVNILYNKIKGEGTEIHDICHPATNHSGSKSFSRSSSQNLTDNEDIRESEGTSASNRLNKNIIDPICLPNPSEVEVKRTENVISDYEKNRIDIEIKNIVRNLYVKLQDELVYVMARDQFSRFVLSKYYKQWRATETSHAMATTIVDAKREIKTQNDKNNNNKQICDESAVTFAMNAQAKKILKPANLTTSALSNVNKAELEDMLGSESWLPALIVAVEALPISFTLSSASKKGYPIIYGNKYFEKLMGVNRTEIIGESFLNLFQCHVSDPTKIEIIKDAAKTMKEAILTIRSCNYSGNIFNNLIAMKPISNDRKKFLYIISINFDVSREVDECQGKLRLATDLMKYIPNTILTDDEHYRFFPGLL
eukprot:gene4473-6324_t